MANMKTLKTHKQVGRYGNAECGIIGGVVTKKWKDVTCKKCLKKK